MKIKIDLSHTREGRNYCNRNHCEPSPRGSVLARIFESQMVLDDSFQEYILYIILQRETL
jgi:hypothetical protein